MAFLFFLFSLLAFSSDAALASSGELLKRDSASIFVPARVDIPLTFNNDGRYLLSVAMAQQQFNFTFSTGTGLSYVAGTGCQTCSSVSLYNQSASSSAEPVANSENVPYFNGTTNASIIKEDFVVMNQQLDNPLAQLSNNVIGGTVSGMLGFGTNRNITSGSSTPSPSSSYQPLFQDSIFGQWLLHHPTALNFTFGVALNPPAFNPTNSSSSTVSPAPSSAGVMNWLQSDPSAYDQSTLSWVDVDNTLAASTNSDGSTDATDPQDWTVSLNGWTFISGDSQVTHHAQIVANVDPLYQGIYIPLDMARLLHDSIPGALPLPTVSTLGSLAQMWSIPCDSTFTFGIIVGSQTYTLDKDILIIKQADGTCLSGIEAWTSSNINQYLLGARFMSALYMIFCIPPDGPNQLGFASRASQSNHKSSNIGAIVGGTIGGVAVILLAVLGFGYLYIRRKQQKSQAIHRSTLSEEEEKEGQIAPFTLYAPHSPENSPPVTANSQTVFFPHSSINISSSEISPSQVAFVQSTLTGTPVASPSRATFEIQEHSSEQPPAYEEMANASTSSSHSQHRDTKHP
ncbi:aspartic peptidase domain-containing protein [Abortiporus biennis]|nr:aspartic peptidase domain-containing protein [Abortiporus biennis]